jgi:hypothetical protein
MGEVKIIGIIEALEALRQDYANLETNKMEQLERP